MTEAGQPTVPEPPSAQGQPSPIGVPSAHTIVIPPDLSMVTLLGPRDELLRAMEHSFPHLDIHVRGNEFHVSGAPGEVALLERLIDELLVVLGTGQPLNRDAVERSVSMLRAQTHEHPADVLTMNIVSNRGRTIRPKTLNQKHYVDAIDKHTIVFAIGPAGTGKTYLAVAKAVAALQSKQVSRIILTRPAVEAGERLGFLPGTINDKIDPYLRPLYDALHDMVDSETIPRLMAAGTPSVLKVVRDILDCVDDVHFAELNSHDVVRHYLVAAIVDAYGRWDDLPSSPRARRAHEAKAVNAREHRRS